MTPDVVQAALKSTKVLYENDRIRELELKSEKGQKLGCIPTLTLNSPRYTSYRCFG
jgi:hypothetical protein